MDMRKHLSGRTARRAAVGVAAFASAATIGSGITTAAHAATVNSWQGAGDSSFVGEDGHRVMLEADLGSDNGVKAFSLGVGTYHVGRGDIAGAQDVTVTFTLQQASPASRKTWQNVGVPVSQTVRLDGSTVGKDVAGPTLPLTHRYGSAAMLYRVSAEFRWSPANKPNATFGRRILTPSAVGELACPAGVSVLHCMPFEDNDGTGNAGMMLY